MHGELMRDFLLIDVGKSYLRARIAGERDGGAYTVFDVPPQPNSRDGFDAVTRFAFDALRHARQTRTIARLVQAILCVPGRTTPDRLSCTLDYLDAKRFYKVDEELRGLPIDTCRVYNDLGAGVAGVRHAAPDTLHLLCGRRTHRTVHEVTVLALPGSGLGVGIGLPDGTTIPSVAGELQFGVFVDRPDEVGLFNHVTEGRKQRSYESVVSAKGLLHMLDHLIAQAADPPSLGLRHYLRRVAPIDRARTVSRIALGLLPGFDETQRETCRTTLRLFACFLSRFLQNLCLILQPSAVYMGGRIVNENKTLVVDTFVEHFQDHYRSDYFTSVPVFLSSDPSLNLSGAFYLATSAP